MSVRNVVSPANIVFLLGGLFFLVVSALNEGSIYSVGAAVLCFVSIGLAFKEDLFFVTPFRVATSIFVLILAISQLIADAYAPDTTSFAIIGSILLNGALLVLFLGATLLSIHPLMKQESKEEEEEEERENLPKKKKKLTYEV